MRALRPNRHLGIRAANAYLWKCRMERRYTSKLVWRVVVFGVVFAAAVVGVVFLLYVVLAICYLGILS